MVHKIICQWQIFLFKSILFITDYNHTERAFFQKSQTFGLGHSNWAESFWGIWGIFVQFISTNLVLWVPFPCFPLIYHFIYKKLSLHIQIENKYLGLIFNLGRKELGIQASFVQSPPFLGNLGCMILTSVNILDQFLTPPCFLLDILFLFLAGFLSIGPLSKWSAQEHECTLEHQCGSQ